MKSAKSLQIHSHNIFSRLLSKEYGVYQQFIYTVMASSESKIEALRFEKYELVGTGTQEHLKWMPY